MSQVRSHRISVQQQPGTPRSQSSSSIASTNFPRPRRININLPKQEATAQAFHSLSSSTSSTSITGNTVFSIEKVRQDRARYEELVLNNATSEAILKMPNVATKPRSVEEIFDFELAENPSGRKVVCRLPSVTPGQHINTRVSMDITNRTFSSSPNFSNQRPGLDRKRSSQYNHSSSGHSIAPESDREDINSKRSSMNPLAATFTPTFPKSSLSDCSSDHGSDTRPTPSRRGTTDSRDSMITGLGISSPSLESVSRHQNKQGLSVITKALSPSQQDRPIFGESPPMTANSIATTMTTTTDLEEFGVNLMRQINENIESKLHRHLSKIVNASSSTSSTVPQSPTVSQNGSFVDDATISQLKKLLRNTNSELGLLKEKNQELRDANHKLERQHLEATHQVARLQDFESSHQFLLTKVRELESTASSTSSTTDSVLETSSINGNRQNNGQNNNNTSKLNTTSNSAQSQQVQKLLREVAAITSEPPKDAKSQTNHQEVRSSHYIDLENERHRLIDELSQKTVAMEDLWNKNEALMLRAREYEKRVWELESQVAALEADCAFLPQIRSDLVEMEARADAADALVEKLQDMEGQVALVKSLQQRIQELETTNAELDHSNWDLSEKLNIANNQHTLLTKEFESFRSKDKDDRRLEFLVTRNRELETLLAEQTKISPDYKDEYKKVSSELDKLKIRLPQLEGQAKQVALLRSKTLQLEKQIKTMEDLEPRLGEMQQLHERNLFLESELGELEHLRARELELEHDLEEARGKLIQFESAKTRINSFSGLKQLQGGRARSGSVAQHNPPFLHNLVQQPSQQESSEDGTSSGDLRIKTSGTITPSHLGRSSHSIGSIDAILSPKSPKREFPPANATASTPTSMWPSGRASMSMSNASQRMSTGSSTSTVMSSNSIGQHFRQEFSTPVSPEESADEEDRKELGDNIKPTELTEEPQTFAESGVVQEVM